MSLKVRDFPDGSDSLLPLQGAQFQSLAWELRSYMLCSAAKKKKKKKIWGPFYCVNSGHFG